MKDCRTDDGILTLEEYLRYCTKVTELDHKDLFLGYIDRKLLNCEVYRTEWETLEIVNEDGKRLEIPAYYIYLRNSARNELANGRDEEK